MKQIKSLKRWCSALPAFLMAALFAPQTAMADDLYLTFDGANGKNNVEVVDEGNNEYTVTINGADPYCATAALGRALANEEHYLVYEYQIVSGEIPNNEVEFFFNPFRAGASINIGGAKSTSSWTTQVVNIEEALKYTDYPWGGASSYLRFDFGNKSNAVWKVRNLRITDTDPNAWNEDPEEFESATKIATAADFKAFAQKVNAGETSLNAKLIADIDLTGSDIMIGTSKHYTGIFDGQGHTITVAYNRTSGNDAALFQNLEGTVRNLVIDGTINISTKYAAGVAAHAWGATIDKVVSLVNINTTIAGDGTHAGIIAVNEGGGTVISNTVFAGSIKGSATNNCGGIIGWSSGSDQVTNCLMIADIQIGSGDNNIVSRNSGNCNVNKTYYTDTFPGAAANGTMVTLDQVKSGEVAVMLDWLQTLGVQAFPNPLEGGKVIANEDGTYSNPAGEVTLDQSEALLKVGETMSLTATSTSVVKWSSSDESVAQVKDGVVKGLKFGKATITATATDGSGAKASAIITVYSEDVEISKASDLVAFAELVNGGATIKATMANDINMAGVAYTPAGTQANPFKGTFDGKGHKISNLVINMPGKDYIGLIGVITGGGVVKNVTLDKTCKVVGNAFLGVIGGSNGGGEVVIDRVGSECDFIGSAQNVSGIIGVNMSSAATFKITNVYTTGKIAGARESAAITGWAANSSIANLYTISEVSGNDAGNSIYRSNPSVSNSWSLSGHQGSTQVTMDQVKSGELAYKLNQAAGETIFYQKVGEDAYPSFDASRGEVFCVAGAYTNDANTFAIATAEDLVKFAQAVNAGQTTATGIMTADVDMAGVAYTPAGTQDNLYKGLFNGQGHKISNLVVNLPEQEYVGLFGRVTGGATIKNVVLDSSCKFTGKAFMGVVGGSNGGGVVTIDRVASECEFTGSAQNISGIIGVNMSSAANFKITNVYTTGKIAGGRESAAITGWADGGSIFNAYSISEVSGNDAGKSIYRANPGVGNLWSLSGDQSTKMTEDMVKSGELAYKFNKAAGENILFQKIGEDAYPTFDASRGEVFCINGTYVNDLAAVDNIEIASLEDFKMFINIANNINASVDATLTANVDLTGLDYTIGAGNYYAGTFNGQGNTITLGNGSTGRGHALFNNISGTVKNLIIDGTITGADKFAAGVTTYTREGAVIENVISALNINSTINGDGTHGGLIGVSEGTTLVKNAAFVGSIKGQQTNMCGGIVGWTNGKTTLENVLMIGDIQIGDGDNHIMGRNAGNLTVKNCYYGPTYPNAKEDAKMGTAVTMDQVASGEVTYLLNGSQSDAPVWFQTIGEDAAPVLDATHGTVYKSGNSYSNQPWGPNPDGIYEIANAGQLVAFANVVNNGETAAKAILTADIDLTGVDFTPIGLYSDEGGKPNHQFGGVFDGQGHVIKNLSITIPATESWEAGLFSRTYQATLKNFGVVNATVTNNGRNGNSAVRAGVIGGELHATTVQNIYTIGDIVITTEHPQKGGISGEAHNTTLTGCYTTYAKAAGGAVTYNRTFEGEQVANTIATGELCYNLNGGTDNIAYYQTLGQDENPVLVETSKIVFVDENGGYTNEVPVWYALQVLIKSAEELAASTKSTTKSALITETSQFSCNCVWPNEGSVDNLLDGNTSTFLHSTLTCQYQGNEYLEVALNKPVAQFAFELTGRGDGIAAGAAWHDTPNGVRISGSNDGENWTAVTDLRYAIPNDHNAHYESDVVNLGAEYKYVRFGILGSTSGQPYWNISEFQMYETAMDPACPYASVKGLNYVVDIMSTVAAAKKAVAADHAATAADIAELQAEIDNVKAYLDGTLAYKVTDLPLLTVPGGQKFYYYVKNARSGKYATYQNANAVMTQTNNTSAAGMYYFVAAGEVENGYVPVKMYSAVSGENAIASFNAWNEAGSTVYLYNAADIDKGIAIGFSNNYANSNYFNDYSSSTVGGWTAKGDAGSVWAVEPVSGADQPTIVEVDYNHIMAGQTVFTEKAYVAAGENYPAPALPAYVECANKPSGKVYATASVDLQVTDKTPFKASESFETATWYKMIVRPSVGTRYMTSEEAEPGVMGMQRGESSRDSYLWAFVGNPYDGYQIMNYAAGEGQYLNCAAGNGNAPVMAETAQAWTIGKRNDSQFGFGVNGASWLNNHGGDGSNVLKLWQDGPANDEGSAFRIVEVDLNNRYAYAYDPAPVVVGEDYEIISSLDVINATVSGTSSVAVAAGAKAQVKNYTASTMGTASMKTSGNVLTITLADAITSAAGHSIVAVTIPANTLTVDGILVKKAIKLTYFIGYTSKEDAENDAKQFGADAINGIMADAESTDVYNLAGAQVKKNASASELKNLKGVYIVNGKKLLVK